MTYDAFESGAETGSPIELYEFVLAGSALLFTSSEDRITVVGQVYEPEAITRENIRQGAEDRSDLLAIEVPVDNAVAARYPLIPPGRRSTLTIRRMHRDDPDEEVRVIFRGFLRDVRYPDGQRAIISVLPVTSGASRKAMRFGFQGLCNHVLYDPRDCRVDEDGSLRGLAFKLSQATITAVDADGILTVDGADDFPDNYFAAGDISILELDEPRLVVSQVGDQIEPLLPFSESVVGMKADLRAGCDHSPDHCKNKFANFGRAASDPITKDANYGGFFFVPDKNIFEKGLDTT